MAKMFKPATRKNLKARIALIGGAGSGKTATAIRLARRLVGPGGRIAVIDTEYGSASKEIGQVYDGEPPLQFDVKELSHFSPDDYTAAIENAGENGYDAVIADSLSHAWNGVGGALAQVDAKADRPGGSFAAWKTVTPKHLKMITAILASPCHVIATMRSKMYYGAEMVGGKMKPVKIGIQPIQREGMEYEFDMVCDIDVDHALTVGKNRGGTLDGQSATKPGGDFFEPFIAWLSIGQAAVERESTKPSSIPSDTKKTKKGVVLNGEVETNPHEQHESEPCGKEMGQFLIETARNAKMPKEAFDDMLKRQGVAKAAEIPLREAEKIITALTKRANKGVPFA